MNSQPLLSATRDQASSSRLSIEESPQEPNESEIVINEITQYIRKNLSGKELLDSYKEEVEKFALYLRSARIEKVDPIQKLSDIVRPLLMTLGEILRFKKGLDRAIDSYIYKGRKRCKVLIALRSALPRTNSLTPTFRPELLEVWRQESRVREEATGARKLASEFDKLRI